MYSGGRQQRLPAAKLFAIRPSAPRSRPDWHASTLRLGRLRVQMAKNNAVGVNAPQNCAGQPFYRVCHRTARVGGTICASAFDERERCNDTSTDPELPRLFRHTGRTGGHFGTISQYSLLRMAKKCPRCGSADVQRSAYADHEERYIAFLKSPYRCKKCRERFWAVSRKLWRGDLDVRSVRCCRRGHSYC